MTYQTTVNKDAFLRGPKYITGKILISFWLDSYNFAPVKINVIKHTEYERKQINKTSNKVNIQGNDPATPSDPWKPTFAFLSGKEILAFPPTNNKVCTLCSQEAQPWIKTMLKNLIINIFMNRPVFLVGCFAPLVLHNYKNNHSVINSTVSHIHITFYNSNIQKNVSFWTTLLYEHPSCLGCK